MIVLGLETSTAMCSVAAVSDEGWSIERSVVEAHIHSEKLLTLVAEVMRETRVTLRDLSAIAVSIGPGSFTGLRIGLSSAKGFCSALEKPLVVVPTFDAIAATVASRLGHQQRLVIALDAKRNDYYVATYVVYQGQAQNDEEVAVWSETDVVRKLSSLSDLLLITDRTKELSQQVGGALAVEHVVDHCHASTVARIGLRKFLAKEFSDPASTEPMYLKDFVVLTKSIAPHT